LQALELLASGLFSVFFFFNFIVLLFICAYCSVFYDMTLGLLERWHDSQSWRCEQDPGPPQGHLSWASRPSPSFPYPCQAFGFSLFL
jgi:hypothetical protein